MRPFEGGTLPGTCGSVKPHGSYAAFLGDTEKWRRAWCAAEEGKTLLFHFRGFVGYEQKVRGLATAYYHAQLKIDCSVYLLRMPRLVRHGRAVSSGMQVVGHRIGNDAVGQHFTIRARPRSSWLGVSLSGNFDQVLLEV